MSPETRHRETKRLTLIALLGTIVIAGAFAWPTLHLWIFTRSHVSVDEEGSLRCRVHRFSDQPQGVALLPPNGEVLITPGRLEGPYEWRWPDGCPRLIGQWKGGHGAGTWREYSESGELVKTFEFPSPGEKGEVVFER